MRSVNIQFIRICISLGLLLMLGAWQIKFVVNAVGANPTLNLVILGTFLFGVMLVFFNMMKMYNEYYALSALQEIFADLKNGENASEADPMWKYYRCRNLARVFKKPDVLAQAYHLISEQLYKDSELRISAGTMATLVDGIDEQLNEQKALIQYVSGILVMLGLIGTFVGLMVTLASVGDILAGLDLTGGDPTAMISNLMTSLQTPLGGMATGFSSSLFGLITSLTLGVMHRFVSLTGHGMKTDFANWISNAVELQENADAGNMPEAQQAATSERRLSLLMRSARYSMLSNMKQNKMIDELNTALVKLSGEARENRAQLVAVTHCLQSMSDQNKIIHSAMCRSVNALNTLSHSTNIKLEVEELTALLSSEVEQRDAKHMKALRQIYKKIGEIPTAGADGVITEYEKEGASLAAEMNIENTELSIESINTMLKQAVAEGTIKATSVRQDEKPDEQQPQKGVAS